MQKFSLQGRFSVSGYVRSNADLFPAALIQPDDSPGNSQADEHSAQHVAGIMDAQIKAGQAD